MALVLGAGNVAPIAVQDVLTKLFNEGTVCVVKMNPVNACLGTLFEEAFAALIARHSVAGLRGRLDREHTWTASVAIRMFFGPHSRGPFPMAQVLQPQGD